MGHSLSDLPFSSLPLKPALLATLNDLGFTAMTQVQAASLPAIIEGRDVLAQAKTGSGKTAAFGLGLLNRLNVKRFRVQSLVLCPTRELADQVAKELRRFARGIHNIKILTLCGGVPVGPQIGSLEHGAHIIVGTPGRVLDHLQKGRLDLGELQQLVLDEADRMLEMGFADALEQISAYMPDKRQSLLFSATFPEPIAELARAMMDKPLSIKLEQQHDQLSIAQQFIEVTDTASRLQAVEALLLAHRPESAVIFCNTKRETQELADSLERQGFSVRALHGDLDQRERDQALVQFALKSVVVLVATDVAARGLDIEALDLVINYQLAFDPEVHVHRVGRTGRAGASGQAVSLVGPKDGMRMALLEDIFGPQTMSELPQPGSFSSAPIRAAMRCIRIEGGKKHKLRPGDILGAITADNRLTGADVGKIQIQDIWSYVAVRSECASTAVKLLSERKLKGKSFRAWAMKP
ncbi:ATP-dependent RNA helicase DbpA [Shewanella algae]|nr:ATP-dependent RNA helicase DbpA [Shewanella algae]MBO2581053.1 ATP-dependent RNA helicase DbpA [Shewanella algae]MBO2627417.1 ATP-dependent RNA helicase DbpA [Shewanella algae]QTE96990.1 ATP-dependent RNA helicase DbpA [Shewanella algae]HDS1204531.1 ATP-dependent RNA helicase DbpA [Shewanella algae]